jgi:hypothetical protein
MITSRLMLTTLLLGSLALPALAQAHPVAPHVNSLHHRTTRPVHRAAAAANAVPDVKAPVVAATPASPVAGPMAGTPATMPRATVGTAPLAPMSTPRIVTTVPAAPGAKVN